MRLLLPLLALLCGCVSAQTIDAERSRFLSAPNGRTGTYAPYRLVLTDLQGADSFTVHSDAPGVSLRREVASAGKQELEVVLPIMVGDDVTVRVSDEAGLERASISPRMPLRRIEPDYARPYAAVFSNNPVYARVLVPNSPRTAVCDYFELGEFFNDWRLFDGYDALVIINPDEARLPPGSQRAIAEYCSLGGNALIIGSFRLGEKDVDVPAPADPQVLLIRGVAVQRFGYGPGAIYRVGFDDLQHSQLAADVVVDALRDQFWFGAADAPGGKPQSRIPAADALSAAAASGRCGAHATVLGLGRRRAAAVPACAFGWCARHETHLAGAAGRACGLSYGRRRCGDAGSTAAHHRADQRAAWRRGSGGFATHIHAGGGFLERGHRDQPERRGPATGPAAGGASRLECLGDRLAAGGAAGYARRLKRADGRHGRRRDLPRFRHPGSSRRHTVFHKRCIFARVVA